MPSHRRLLPLLLALTVVAPAVTRAQPAEPAAPTTAAPAPATLPPNDNVCLGFTFGPWTPRLDWARSGHAGAMDSARVPRAPGGRSWAASQLASAADSTLMLFPPWWPAGVWVTLARARVAVGDSVAGTATALVADGHVRPSRSRVTARRLPCRG